MCVYSAFVVAKLSPFTIRLFFSFSHIYLGLHVLAGLDLDGVLSNSYRAIEEFKQLNPDLPTSHVMLAARPSKKEHGIKTSPSNNDNNDDVVVDEEMEALVARAVALSKDKLVYVGSVGGLESKLLLAPLLREAMKANLPICQTTSLINRTSSSHVSNGQFDCSPLVVFGSGWGDSVEFSSIWGGLLPHAPGALTRVYEVAFAVIGIYV